MTKTKMTDDQQKLLDLIVATVMRPHTAADITARKLSNAIGWELNRTQLVLAELIELGMLTRHPSPLAN